MNDATLAAAMADFAIAMMAMADVKKKAETALNTMNQIIGPTLKLTNENGWLTEAGRAALSNYWMAGVPATVAAKMIGISGGGAWRWYNRWNKEWNEQNKEASA
jgi:hypothetical protein